MKTPRFISAPFMGYEENELLAASFSAWYVILLQNFGHHLGYYISD
jgi:hypothetical protein